MGPTPSANKVSSPIVVGTAFVDAGAAVLSAPATVVPVEPATVVPVASATVVPVVESATVVAVDAVAVVETLSVDSADPVDSVEPSVLLESVVTPLPSTASVAWALVSEAESSSPAHAVTRSKVAMHSRWPR